MSSVTEPTGEITPDLSHEPAGSRDADTGSLHDDDLFHLLQNHRRRAVIRYLQGRSGAVRMRDIAEQVAAWEHDTTLAELTSTQRQRVYIALYQSHLDTLAEAGVIYYNKPRGIVEPRPLLEYVARHLDAAEPEGEDDPDGDWTTYYLLASGVSTVLFGSATAGLASSTYLTSMAIGLLTVAMFTAITLARVLGDIA